MEFNVAYEYEGKTKFYCVYWGLRGVMENQLKVFRQRYVNGDGTPKAYPNGKGFYPITNARIVSRSAVRRSP